MAGINGITYAIAFGIRSNGLSKEYYNTNTTWEQGQMWIPTVQEYIKELTNTKWMHEEWIRITWDQKAIDSMRYVVNTVEEEVIRVS